MIVSTEPRSPGLSYPPDVPSLCPQRVDMHGEPVEHAVVLAAAQVEGRGLVPGHVRQVRGDDHVIVECEHRQGDVPVGESGLDSLGATQPVITADLAELRAMLASQDGTALPGDASLARAAVADGETPHGPHS
jgi:hypothetical protein